MSTSTTRQLIKLALPTAGVNFTLASVGLIDVIMVSHIGVSAVGAIGLAQAVIKTASVALCWGVGFSVQIIVARRVGQKDPAGAVDSLHGGLALSLLAILPVCAVLLVFAPFFLRLVTSNPTIVNDGVAYLRARVVGLPVAAASMAFLGYWYGTRRPHMGLIGGLVVNGVNLLLNWILIFGYFGFPALGVLGAGIATVIGQFFGLVVVHIPAARSRAREHGFFARRPSKAMIGAQFRLAWPFTVWHVLGYFASVLAYRIIASLGKVSLAAVVALQRFYGVVGVPMSALLSGAVTMTGMRIGADSAEGVREVVRKHLTLSLAFAGLLAGVCALMPRTLVRMIVALPVVREAAFVPFVILIGRLLLAPFANVFRSVVIGSGGMKQNLIANSILQWVVYLPLAYLLTLRLGYGLNGFVVADTVLVALDALAMYLLYRRGYWRKSAV